MFLYIKLCNFITSVILSIGFQTSLPFYHVSLCVSQFDEIPFENATDTCGGFDFSYGVSDCMHSPQNNRCCRKPLQFHS